MSSSEFLLQFHTAKRTGTVINQVICGTHENPPEL